MVGGGVLGFAWKGGFGGELEGIFGRARTITVAFFFFNFSF